MAKRGQLTPGVQNAAMAHLGRGITQEELRLLPYFHYALLNGRYLDPRKLNGSEQALIAKWEDEGHVKVVGDQIATCSRPFYDLINEMLWRAYADFANQPEDCQ